MNIFKIGPLEEEPLEEIWQDQTNRIESLVILGLGVDGGHHKQWVLEEIYKLIRGEKELDKLREVSWIEEGIAP